MRCRSLRVVAVMFALTVSAKASLAQGVSLGVPRVGGTASTVSRPAIALGTPAVLGRPIVRGQAGDMPPPMAPRPPLPDSDPLCGPPGSPPSPMSAPGGGGIPIIGDMGGVFNGFAAPVMAGGEPCNPWCGEAKFGVFADFLYVTARDVSVPYAQAVTIATDTPTSPLGIVDVDYSPAFRVGGFFGLGEAARVEIAYTWLEVKGSDAIGAPAGTLLLPLTTVPVAALADADAAQAAANLTLSLNQFDADYRALISQGPGWFFGWRVGGRWASLKQQFDATYQIGGVPTVVANNVDFDGGGPRLGLDAESRLPFGFLVYGRGAATFLLGQFSSQYTQATNNVVEASIPYTSNRLVPVGDVEMGFGWASWRGRVRLHVGYMVSVWLNALTNGGFIQAVRDGNFSNSNDSLSDNLTFDGLVVRLQVAF